MGSGVTVAVYVAVMPARTVALEGETSIRKSVTRGIGAMVAVTVEPLLNVTVALLPRPVGATAVGVTTMLTVAVPPTLNVPIAHVTVAGVPVAPVQEPGEVVALLKVAPLVGSTSVKFTLNAGSGPLFVMVYLNVSVLPTPTVVGVGTPVIVKPLTAPSLLTNASLGPCNAAWNGLAFGKFPDAVWPVT